MVKDYISYQTVHIVYKKIDDNGIVDPLTYERGALDGKPMHEFTIESINEDIRNG